jgi:hypothetical protein
VTESTRYNTCKDHAYSTLIDISKIRISLLVKPVTSMTSPLEHEYLQEGGSPTFIVVSGSIASAVPSNARVVKSLVEARKHIGRGEAYVEYRRYIGLDGTGSMPWVVTINDGDHQVVDSQHSTLHKAFQIAVRMNAPEPVESYKPEHEIISLFRRFVGDKR